MGSFSEQSWEDFVEQVRKEVKEYFQGEDGTLPELFSEEFITWVRGIETDGCMKKFKDYMLKADEKFSSPYINSIREILTSEQTYHDSLSEIQTLEKAESDGKKFGQIFKPSSAIAMALSSINSINAISEQILSELKVAMGNYDRDKIEGDLFKAVSSIFLKYCKYFEVYGPYAGLYKQCGKEMKKFNETPIVSKFFEGKSETLGFYFVMPIQRLPRYRLLFEEIIKEVGKKKSFEEVPLLEEALGAVKKAASNMNEYVRQSEQRKNFNSAIGKVNKFNVKINIDKKNASDSLKGSFLYDLNKQGLPGKFVKGDKAPPHIKYIAKEGKTLFKIFDAVKDGNGKKSHRIELQKISDNKDEYLAGLKEIYEVCDKLREKPLFAQIGEELSEKFGVVLRQDYKTADFTSDIVLGGASKKEPKIKIQSDAIMKLIKLYKDKGNKITYDIDDVFFKVTNQFERKGEIRFKIGAIYEFVINFNHKQKGVDILIPKGIAHDENKIKAHIQGFLNFLAHKMNEMKFAEESSEHQEVFGIFEAVILQLEVRYGMKPDLFEFEGQDEGIKPITEQTVKDSVVAREGRIETSLSEEDVKEFTSKRIRELGTALEFFFVEGAQRGEFIYEKEKDTIKIFYKNREGKYEELAAIDLKKEKVTVNFDFDSNTEEERFAKLQEKIEKMEAFGIFARILEKQNKTSSRPMTSFIDEIFQKAISNINSKNLRALEYPSIRSVINETEKLKVIKEVSTLKNAYNIIIEINAKIRELEKKISSKPNYSGPEQRKLEELQKKVGVIVSTQRSYLKRVGEILKHASPEDRKKRQQKIEKYLTDEGKKILDEWVQQRPSQEYEHSVQASTTARRSLSSSSGSGSDSARSSASEGSVISGLVTKTPTPEKRAAPIAPGEVTQAKAGERRQAIPLPKLPTAQPKEKVIGELIAKLNGSQITTGLRGRPGA